ncbi:MAG: tRNA preQ1(34) S-adenosylmethionine ribosyltransferase-isomerase QueA [bacterium]|nr:tRNA preQ1(34) S-adenosylmethionine ribosyltransferase-isomerase QueA [bacterium]
MDIKDFDYKLDISLIAQKPAQRRDHSRLLVYSCANSNIQHRFFKDIADYFSSGDVIVMNNSKVLAARLLGNKITGGKAEVFLLKKINQREWECLVRAKGNKNRLEINFAKKVRGVVAPAGANFKIKFNISGKKLTEFINYTGLTPLPPYIKRAQKNRSDKNRYQTVYADDKKFGSVAAPTAGLHFTKSILHKLKRKGVQIEYVTLHVGLGTFQPVRVSDIKKHQMHSEHVEVDARTLKNIIRAKKENRRIIAVGTTSVRVLEAVVAKNLNKKNNKSLSEDVDIFIYPGYNFRIVDGLITNFHLPRSTLLMLVSAFLQPQGARNGITELKKIYRCAQEEKYRFFSYGDAMLII